MAFKGLKENEARAFTTARKEVYRSNVLLPADNSCPNCEHEKTCGYSPLAMLGERRLYGNSPCCLGLMSSGKPFFTKAQGR